MLGGPNRKMSIDRLSTLPESLIIHILNFLGVKEAGITSVLSKRWQYLWADLPCLCFNEDKFRGNQREFVSWVNRTLNLRCVNYVDKFQIAFEYERRCPSDVTSWLEFAVKNKVKQLILLLDSSTDLYMLPQVMYSASSLTFLRIQECTVAPHRKIEWKSLTELIINSVELNDDVIAKILAGCPVLHTLELESCWGYNCLDITSPNLLSLLITNFEAEDDILEISAPYIQTLNVSEIFIVTNKLCLTNIASLVRASIDFDLGSNLVTLEALNYTMEIFEKIQHVKELELGYESIQLISELVVYGWLLPQSTRVSLTIQTQRNENYVSGIVGLLESSPDLDTLVIRCSGSYERSVRTWGPIAIADLNCDLPHLKFVNLTNCADPNLGGEPMLTTVRIILKRATTLEKMMIKVEKFSPSDFIKMTETVLSYPRSSVKVVVDFCQ